MSGDRWDRVRDAVQTYEPALGLDAVVDRAARRGRRRRNGALLLAGALVVGVGVAVWASNPPDSNEPAEVTPTPTPSPSVPYLPNDERWAPEVTDTGDGLEMPVTFPDGTSAVILLPRQIDPERLSVRPYATVNGPEPCQGSVDVIPYDPRGSWVRGSEPAATYPTPGGGAAELWRGVPDHAPYEVLMYRVGQWSVMLPCDADKRNAEAGLREYVEHLSISLTPEGLLRFEGSGPLELYGADGGSAAPGLSLSTDDVTFEISSQTCDPDDRGDRDPADEVVQWCIDGRFYAYGNSYYTPESVEELGRFAKDLDVVGLDAGTADAETLAGVTFSVCRPTSISGEFGDLGDTLWTFAEERAPGLGCERRAERQYVGVGTAEQVNAFVGTDPIMGVDGWWSPYAAPDIDGDGIDEIVVATDLRGFPDWAIVVWLFQVSDTTVVPLSEACAGCDFAWNSAIGSGVVETGATTLTGLYCGSILGSPQLGEGLVLWQYLSSDPDSVYASMYEMRDGELHVVDDATFDPKTEAQYPSTGQVEICGATTHQPSTS